MNQQQPTLTHQATSQIAPIDPTPIIQSESPTAVILAIAYPYFNSDQRHHWLGASNCGG